MVLIGLNPDDCLEAARSGIQFWNDQFKLQLDCLKTAVSTTRLQMVEMQSHYEEKIAEMNREISSLREECHRELKGVLFTCCIFHTSAMTCHFFSNSNGLVSQSKKAINFHNMSAFSFSPFAYVTQSP